MNIPILFENESVLVVDKPEKIATIPERTPGSSSVLQILSADRADKLYVVHRLDKEVSGVLVFAKAADVHKQLSEMFETRRVKKTYLALVHGRVKEKSGVIDKPLREFGSGRMGVDPRGKTSETGYAVEKTSAKHSLLRAYPLSGRRHQIRVHLYSVGHAIVGDPLYGEPELQKDWSRLFLHALAIEIPMPNADAIKVESALPPVFAETIKKLVDSPA